MITKTHLHLEHISCGAKMVDFHGWEMPLHYGSQINEHQAVRQHAGMFDVSHMTIVDVLGTGSRQFLRKLLTNDIDKMTQTGKALYTCMCNERGGIIDDLIVYHRNSENYRLVLNSATHDNDLKWIRDKIHGFSAGLQERHELVMLAIQGPEAIKMTLDILNPTQADAVSTLQNFECVDIGRWFFARTGYTGESGLEIILPKEDIKDLWSKLLNVGITPCGLGARDTLRLEAGMMLYGQDMDESTTPLESALSWTVAWEPADRDFIGMGAMLSQKQLGPNRKLVGLTLDDKGIMRAGQRVVVPGLDDGVITSGTYSPTLKKSIAFARVPKDVGDKVMVEIRGSKFAASVGKPRFLPE